MRKKKRGAVRWDQGFSETQKERKTPTAGPSCQRERGKRRGGGPLARRGFGFWAGCELGRGAEGEKTRPQDHAKEGGGGAGLSWATGRKIEENLLPISFSFLFLFQSHFQIEF